LRHQLYTKGKTKVHSFDCVVWNFPYPMGKGKIPGDVCAKLMRGFFRSVNRVLEDGGQVRVTLAMGQGRAVQVDPIKPKLTPPGT